MPRRLIAISVALILIGILPRILSLFSVQLQWPTQLPALSFIPAHYRKWFVDYGSFEAVAIVGVALLLLATFLVGRKLLTQRSEDKPLRTSDVLLAEVEEIHGRKPDDVLSGEIRNFYENMEQRLAEGSRGASRRQDREKDELSNVSPRVFRWLNGIDRTALCLSGGGIRSASFGLGVLQALAMHPRRSDGEGAVSNPQKSLLAQFNYLSTVSGGGYIGSWFSAWVQQVGYAKVWRDLVRHPDREQDPGQEAPPIKWLRVHGNYLTPKVGLSGDTLADVAILLRNLLLNWLVLLPVLCAVLILMKLMALQVFELWELKGDSGAKYWVPLLAWLLLLVGGLSFTLRHRPTRTFDESYQADEAAFLKWALAPSILAAVAFTLFLALAVLHVASIPADCTPGNPLKGGNADCDLLAIKDPNLFVFLSAAFIGALIYALSYAISWIRSWAKVCARTWKRLRAYFTGDGNIEIGQPIAGNFWRWTLSGAIYGTLVTVVTYLFLNYDAWIEKSIFLDYELFNRARAAPADAAGRRHLLALIYLGVPLMLGAQLIAEMIFVGLTSEEPNSEEDREWLGRGAGLFFLAGLAWLLIMHLAYIGTDITVRAVAFFFRHPVESLVALGLFYLVGAIAASVGRSSRTPAHQGSEMRTTARSANATLSIVAAILVVVLIIGVSALLDHIVLGRAIAEDLAKGQNVGILHDDRLKFLLALAAVLLVAWIASRSINVNRFSMHALYRNRLIRTFLGASNPNRRPNPFTDFARDDNPLMYTLWPSRHTWSGEKIEDGQLSVEDRSWRPFHIVNIALNVTSSQEHLEWQERKAASFTVSPLHCGSVITGFRSSKVYGGGISLGTAMAVSGAAASPNQGYNSSPSVAFLMALFNVRLGWWLGNPGTRGRITHTYDGPLNAAVPFLAEMLGMTSDTNKYVYLSDGGHFENLGLYEMVRRRCRFIVLVDAGCDPLFAFEDLGNAVRKIEIDLGVPIRFYGLDKLRPRLGGQVPGNAVSGRSDKDDQPPPYHAMGIIDYPAADGRDETAGGNIKKGIILYLKPGYHGTERSAGIRSYASSNLNYPHDDTANQWFGESQMESYRALGFEIVDDMLRSALKDLKGKTDPTLPDILSVLEQRRHGGGRAEVAPQPEQRQTA